MRKLYYEDCTRTRFTARVTGCRKAEKGYEITLDATAFYPEGGGQPCDLGVLGHVQVLHVREQDGQVVHLCDRPLPIGGTVQGTVDGERRLELAQLHSGEHILSGLIHRKYGYHNVGFHIGGEVMTVDFDGPLTWPELTDLETQANRAVWQNLPLRCWYPEKEELARLEYRSKKALEWPVRIVEIPGVDRCACCGVHVASTGQIGLIKILSWVKFHQGVRIEMLCGLRALAHAQAVYDQNRQVSQTLSAKPLETAEAARRISDQLSAEKFRAVGLERRVLRAIAGKYAGRGNVLHTEPGLDPAGVRALAEEIRAVCGGTAAVFSPEEDGAAFCLVGEPAEVKRLGGALVQALDGRGGGKPGCFQGCVRAGETEVAEFFRAAQG